MRCLQVRPELPQRPFLDAGYIAAADAQAFCHLPLFPGQLTQKAVAQADHLFFLLRQHPLQSIAQKAGVLPGAELLQKVLLPRHHIL